MKYRELLNNITEVAKKHPNINSTFIGDVYELNHRNDVDYCAFVITNGTHRVNSDNEYIDYTLNLFYVDRLTADEGNRTQIHSSGIDFMNSLLRAVEKLGVTVVEQTVNVFNERFNDCCAGVYATVVFRVDIDECGQTIEIISYNDLKTIRIDHNGIYDGLFKQVDVNVATKEPVLEGLSVINNGTYTPKTGVDGFNSVEVNVLPKLETLNATDNGTYTPSTGKDGFDSVTVDVPKEKHNVTSKSITANGVYNSEGDEVWNEVSVNVPEKTFNKVSVTKEYTANGNYSIATPDGYDGISDVNLTVNVPSREPVLESLSVTENGSYTPESGVDGYNSVTVNVKSSGSTGFDTTGITDIDKLYNGSTVKEVSLANFNFDSVKTMIYLFMDAKNLENVSFATQAFPKNCDNTAYMFNGCTALKTTNISDWFNPKVQVNSMNAMFSGCSNLTSNISFHNVDFVYGCYLQDLFNGCASYTGNPFQYCYDNIYPYNTSSMFQGVGSSSLDINLFSFFMCDDMSSMFEDCRNLTDIGFPTDYNYETHERVNQLYISSNANLTKMFKNTTALRNLEISFKIQNPTEYATIDLTEMVALDDGLEDRLQTVKLDGLVFNGTKSVKDLLKGRNKHQQMQTLSISNWNVAGLTTLSDMFGEVTDTNKHTQVSPMFTIKNWGQIPVKEPCVLNNMFKLFSSLRIESLEGTTFPDQDIDLGMKYVEDTTETYTKLFNALPQSTNGSRFYYNQNEYIPSEVKQIAKDKGWTVQGKYIP